MTFASWLRNLRALFRLNDSKPNYFIGHPSSLNRGWLVLESLENRITPSTATWINPSGGDWDTPSNWSTSVVPGAGDDAVINFTGITVSHDSAVSDFVNSLSSQANVDLEGGSLSIQSTSTINAGLTVVGTATTLSLGADLTVTGLFSWGQNHPGGTITGVPGSNLTAAGSMEVNFPGGVTGTLDSLTLVNQGSGVLSGGILSLADGAAVNNAAAASLDFGQMPNGGSIVYGAGAQATPAFVNQGQINADLGDGNSFRVEVPFDNSGTVSVNSGTFRLEQGGVAIGSFLGAANTTIAFKNYALTATSSVNASTVVIEFSTSVAGVYDATVATDMESANTVFSGAVSSLGTLTVDQSVADFAQATRMPATVAALSVEGGSSDLMLPQSLTVTGAFTWGGNQAGGAIVGPTGSIITVAGGLSVGFPGGVTGTLDGLTLVNQGAGILSGGILSLADGAAIDNAAGASLDVSQVPNGGSIVYGTGAQATPAFVNQGQINADLGDGNLFRVEVPFDNSGAVSVNSGTFRLEQGGVATGSFLGAADTTIAFENYDLTAASSVNASTVVIEFSTSVAGAYDASDATDMESANTAFSGAVSSLGALTVDLSVANFSQATTMPTTVAALSVEGGSSDLILPHSITVTGAFTWGGNQAGGAISSPTGSNLTAAGGMSVGFPGGVTGTLDGLTLVNQGSGLLSGGILSLADGASVVNAAGASLEVSQAPNGGSIVYGTGAQATPAFVNLGDIDADLGSGVSYRVEVPFDNSGTLTLNSGTLLINSTGAGFVNNGSVEGQTSSTININTNLSLAPASSMTADTFILASSHAVNLFVSSTLIEPIKVTGSVSLGGQLQIATPADFTPSLGEQFTVVDNQGASTVSGTFDGLPEGSIVADGANVFRISYVGGDGNDVVLTTIATANGPFLVFNTLDSGPGSLRQAIIYANEAAPVGQHPYQITFDIPTTDPGYDPGTGVFTIRPTAVPGEFGLPAITNSVIINGYTQFGSSPNTLPQGDNAVITIELDGDDAGSTGMGLFLDANNCTVEGLAINRFQAYAIWSLSDGDTIAGNFIGTDATGEAALPNSTGPQFQGNSPNGAVVVNGSNTIIGGANPGARNLISGNYQNGIIISDSWFYGANNGVMGDVVLGNFIGTDASGTVPLGNSNGIFIGIDAPGVTIGGTTQAARNIISGNIGAQPIPGQFGAAGVSVSQSLLGTVIEGNFIGTDVTGEHALGNVYGIFSSNCNPGFLIGGTLPGAGNVISANQAYGVVLESNDSSLVEGNLIGTDATGLNPLGNVEGVVVAGTAPGNIVGGITNGARNVIAGNSIDIDLRTPAATVEGNFIGTDITGAKILDLGTGVYFADSSINNVLGGTTPGAANVIASGRSVFLNGSGVQGNLIEGNFIGTDLTGTIDLGSSEGIVVNGAFNNTIGGTSPGAGNFISEIDEAGVDVDSGAGNSIRGNSIHDNAGGGILLNSANNANNNQTFPTLTTAATLPANTIVSGTLASTPNSTFTLDFYANIAPDPSGFGEGEFYLGSVTVVSDGFGNVSFTATVGTAPAGAKYITATATDATGDTSEFSADIHAQNQPPTVGVDNGASSTTYGQIATNTGTWNDPTHQAVVLTASAGTIVEHTNGTWSWSVAAGHGSVGSESVVITATSADGLQATTNFVLTVTPAPLTISAISQTKVFGAALPTLSVSYAGLTNGDTPATFNASPNTPPSVGTTATAASSVGSYPITVSGAMDSDYAIHFVNGTLTITKDGTTTVGNTSAGSASLGQSLTFTAVVTANPPGSGTPTGSVDFFDSTTGVDLGSVALAGGTAHLTTASLPVGVNVITLTYGGSGNFLASSTTLTVTIGSSILILDPKAPGALALSGNATITENGPIFVDSSSATAIQISGNASVTAASIQEVGGFQKSGNAVFHPTPITGRASMADPLAGLAAPVATGSPIAVNLSGNSSLALNPGIFSQITIAGNARLTLNPGVYVIAGGGFIVSGNGTVQGSGVLIYNAGRTYPNSGGSFGSINLSGNSSVNLTASTTGVYAGIGIFQSRENTSPMTLGGNALLGSTGTVYLPSAALVLSGNSNLSAPLLVDSLSLSGNADPSPNLPVRTPAAFEQSETLRLAVTKAKSAVTFLLGNKTKNLAPMTDTRLEPTGEWSSVEVSKSAIIDSVNVKGSQPLGSMLAEAHLNKSAALSAVDQLFQDGLASSLAGLAAFETATA